MRRVTLVALLLVLVGVAAPQTASALSRKQANAIAIRVLHATAGKQNVILFGLPAALKAGTVVFPADPPKNALGKHRRVRVAPLRHAAWLYWLDQVPYAAFSHRSRYLLIDDATGKPLKQASIGWYPAINGRRPPFLATQRSYQLTRYRVFARVTPQKTVVHAALTAAAPARPLVRPVVTIPPNALKGECVLIVSDYSDPAFTNTYSAFREWAGTLKIPTFFATGNGPQTALPGADTKPPNGDDLRDNTTSLIAKNGCTDILIYIAGHGVSTEDGPPTVVTSNKSSLANGTLDQTVTGISANNLSAAISSHPLTDFKVKIDSCYSGRFVDELTTLDDGGHRNSKLNNLQIIEASSPAALPSTFGIEELDGNDNPDHLMEFTNQNLTGLKAFFSSQDEITQAVNQGNSLMAHALDRALELGSQVNHAAKDLGIIPEEVTNFNAPPRLTPIHAVFDPATFTTTYTEQAVGRNLHYTWSLSIPADTACASGFKGGSPQPNQALWQHKDTSQGGTCNHAGNVVGPRGHPGTITVLVFNADWQCKATYVGTEGDNGALTGDGAAPEACTPK